MSIIYLILGFILGSFTVWTYNQVTDKLKIAKFSFGLVKK